LVLPETKESFRGIVESLDLTTESGRTAYAALLSLSPAFAAMVDGLEQSRQEAERIAEEARQEAARLAEEAIKESARLAEQARQNQLRSLDLFGSFVSEVTALADQAFVSLQDAVNAQKELIGVQLEAATETVSSLKNIFDVLSNSVDELRQNVTSSNNMLYSTARGVITTAIASGILPDSDKLNKSLTAAKSGASAPK
jgi:cell division septum initiation protein DivIVA